MPDQNDSQQRPRTNEELARRFLTEAPSVGSMDQAQVTATAGVGLALLALLDHLRGGETR